MLVYKTIKKIESQCLHREVFIGLIIPETIKKILLLFHGYNGSFSELDENLPLLEYAENNQTLIVTPDMDNGYYIDRDRYEVSNFIMKELLFMLFTTYNLKSTTDLYIAGISMGGFGSLLIGSKFPDSFKKIISISGAFIAKDVAIGNPEIVGWTENQKIMEYFRNVFGPFDTLEESIYRNPISSVVSSNKMYKLPEIIVTCGTKDLLFERNVDMISRFNENKISYKWYPIYEGGHDYKCFDEAIKYTFEMINETYR